MDLNGPFWSWSRFMGWAAPKWDVWDMNPSGQVVNHIPCITAGEESQAPYSTDRASATAWSWAAWELCGLASTDLNTARWKKLLSEKEELERRFEEEGKQLRRQQQQEMQALEQRLQEEYNTKKESLQEQHRLQLEQAKLQHQEQVSLHLLPLKSSPC